MTQDDEKQLWATLAAMNIVLYGLIATHPDRAAVLRRVELMAGCVQAQRATVGERVPMPQEVRDAIAPFIAECLL